MGGVLRIEMDTNWAERIVEMHYKCRMREDCTKSERQSFEVYNIILKPKSVIEA